MGGMVGHVQDPLLKRTIRDMESSNMDPAMRKSYDQMAAAGLKLMWSDGEIFRKERDEALSHINGPEDVPRVIAHVAIKVVALVQNESRQKDILPAVGPAAILFMCNALELVEAAKGIQVNEQMLSETTHLVKEGLLDLYKITPGLLQQLAQQQGKPGKAPDQPAPSPAPPAEPEEE